MVAVVVVEMIDPSVLLEILHGEFREVIVREEEKEIKKETKLHRTVNLFLVGIVPNQSLVDLGVRRNRRRFLRNRLRGGLGLERYVVF